MNNTKLALVYGLFLVAFTSMLCAQTPEWIWHDNQGASPADGEVRFFRKTFKVEGPVTKAVLMTTADDEAIVFLNGDQVASTRSWSKTATVNLTKDIKAGDNVLAAQCKNQSGEAAFIAKLEITLESGQKQTIVTDTSWVSSAAREQGYTTLAFAGTGWTKAVRKGLLGDQPWGDVLAVPVATAAEKIDVLPGFKIELLRSSEPGEGSWVCLAIDAKGRLIISPQEGKGNLLRVTLSPSGRVAKMETITAPVGGAMGLLYAFESLYVSGNGPDGLGLYRLRDTNSDDQYDKTELLRKFDGAAGEHGSHGLVLGPDNMIYEVHGNFVKVPKDISPNSPHKNYAEDQLLPRQNDGNGFGNGLQPPGGFVVRMDPDAKHCELFAAGQRNTYDIAFNEDGELFGFDSDMEWDWGTPWYRPIRVNHFVSGGDNGFREGTGKWPNHYPDSLPTTVDIGIGSPTGVRFGTGAKFPAKYQKAFYAMDWSYGRIVAVHLTPKGATYTGAFENFVAPKSLYGPGPKSTLNVTDLEIGQDGAMYFTTGGRGTQSGLYRVTFVGPEPSARELPLSEADRKAADARALRHQLEAFHGKQDSKALDFAWPHLNSEDRWIRYAARIAIESQPVESWQSRALEEERKNAGLTALLALARLAPRSVQNDLLNALDRWGGDGLNEAQKLEALRVLALSFIRMGRPDSETADKVIAALAPHYPSRSDAINRELSQLMIYLQAPGVVTKTLALLDAAPTQEEQLHYHFHLRTIKTGWTLDQRRHYFEWYDKPRAKLAHAGDTVKWFKDAGRDYSDGSSFPNFLKNFRKDAVASLTDAERTALDFILNPQVVAPKPPSVPRNFVKEWKIEDLLPSLQEASQGRSFRKGEAAYNDAQCIACHRFGNEGGSVSPDLTAIASRFARRDILDAIIEPSKIVSEQYQSMTLALKNGDDVSGRIIDEDNQKVVIITDALKQTKTEIKKSDIKSRVPSKLSSMPEGLVNILTKEEILDLVAYLESAGKREHAAFAK